MPGPLPDPNAIRRNAPTIPTTSLPASGRQGEPPEVPSWCELSVAGLAWWRWAWSTPQACAWGTNVGFESMAAQRASLEDDLRALDSISGLPWDHLLEADSAREFKDVVSRAAALATGRLQLLKFANELDNQLGLTPKGMAALRWKIVDDSPAPQAWSTPSNVSSINDRRSRLTDAS